MYNEPVTRSAANYNKTGDLSEQEWKLRQKLAGVYRVFDLLSWDESIYNHISIRIPGTEHFLINPFGLHYSEVTASNLVKVDIDGRLVRPSEWGINPAGFTFHSAIHANVEQGHCVMHVHTTPTLAVCCLENGLAYDNFYSAQLYGLVATHPFEGITLRPDEGERIVASAGEHPVLLLESHGPVVIASGLSQAFSLMWLLNRACEVQLATHAMGKAKPINDAVLRSCQRDSLNLDPNFGAGEDALSAFLRLAERRDPGFRF